MGFRRINTTNINTLATRLKSESAAYWTGYDAKLVDDLTSSVNQLAEEYNNIVIDYSERKTEHLHQLWRPAVITAIVLSCVFGFIGFCVYAGTHFRNFEKLAEEKVRAELFVPKQELEALLMERGYHKVIIPEKIGGIDKNIIIWERIE
jgi:hypothetical protein